jgi:hypothetical protein
MYFHGRSGTMDCLSGIDLEAVGIKVVPVVHRIFMSAPISETFHLKNSLFFQSSYYIDSTIGEKISWVTSSGGQVTFKK